MKKTIDYPLLIATIFITLLGAYMILSATYYVNIFDESNNPMISFVSDFQKIMLGFLVMIIGIFINMKFVKKIAPLLMLISIGALLATVIIGDEINGATRWIRIGNFSLAPAEMAKVTSILYFAIFIEGMTKGEKLYNKAWIIVIIFGGLSAGIMLYQNDLSTAAIYCITVAGMLFVGGSRVREFLIVTLIVSMIAVMFIAFSGFRMDRLNIFSQETTGEITTSAAQQNQAMMAIAEGEIFGVGAGEAYQSKNGLYAAKSDYMFSTVAETTGFVGALVVIGTYIFMLWRMVRIVILSESRYASIVVSGVIVMIASQALIHLLVNAKMMPTTGVTLPFVSSGGTSAIMLLGAVGLVLNLSSNPKSLREK